MYQISDRWLFQVKQTILNFLIRVWSQGLHNNRQRPDILSWGMWTAHSFEITMLIIVRVFLRKYKSTSVFVNRLSLINESQVRKGQKRGQVWVIVKSELSIPVYFISVYIASLTLGSLHHSIVLDSVSDVLSKLVHFLSQLLYGLVVNASLRYLRKHFLLDMLQKRGHHSVSWDIVGHLVGIVGRSEAGLNHAGLPTWFDYSVL